MSLRDAQQDSLWDRPASAGARASPLLLKGCKAMESELRLKERTALLVGPLTRVHQSLAHRFTQLGADVVIATSELDLAQRFANQLSEAREIQERYGRAAALPFKVTTHAGA